MAFSLTHVLTFYLAICLASILAVFLASILTFSLACSVPGVLHAPLHPELAIWSGSLGDHSHDELAEEETRRKD